MVEVKAKVPERLVVCLPSQKPENPFDRLFNGHRPSFLFLFLLF